MVSRTGAEGPAGPAAPTHLPWGGGLGATRSTRRSKAKELSEANGRAPLPAKPLGVHGNRCRLCRALTAGSNAITRQHMHQFGLSGANCLAGHADDTHAAWDLPLASAPFEMTEPTKSLLHT